MDLDKLPKGIIYRHQPRRPNLPHQFGVRDSELKKYIWQSFSSMSEGLEWAKGRRKKLSRGEITAVAPLVSKIGKIYLEGLQTRKGSPRHMAQAREVVEALPTIGADDMSADGFAAKVQTWLNGMTAARPGQKVPGEASPRTKLRKLTILRTIVHLAMEMEGRPRRHDPLRRIDLPPVEHHDKPVFTIPELRIMLSDMSRYRGRRIKAETQAAIELAGGDKTAAAKALGVHFSTIGNRLKTEEQDDGWWLYVAIGIYTGARPSEIQYMRWEWIHWAEECIALPANAPGNKMRIERLITIQPGLFSILKDLYRVGLKGYILPPDITELNESDRTAQFQSYVKRSGIEVAGRGPHSLRHNHGAIATAMKMNPIQIMLNMGHSNVKVSHDYSRTATRFRKNVSGWSTENFELFSQNLPVNTDTRESI